MTDMDDKDRSRDSGRDRDRSRRGDRPSRFSEGNIRDRSPDRGNDRGGRKSSNCRVYVSNISYEYRWQDLKDLFRENVGDVSFVELFVDENDKPKGCGIVEFSDPLLVKKCMEVMHRFDLKGRKLVIKEDFGNERDKYGNIINGRRHRDRDRNDKSNDWGDDCRDNRRSWPDNTPPSLLNNMMGRNSGPAEPPEFRWGNTYGLSPQFLDSLNINRPLVNRVFVANLDYKVDEKKLREVFKLCGKVLDVELYHDKDGNSRGFAVVEYDHPVESVQAISMLHNQLLFDRPMIVRMDRIDLDAPLKLPEGLKGVGMGLGMNGEPLRDVSRNLPSSNNNSNNNSCNMGPGNPGGNVGPVNVGAGNAGPGILGAMPNQAAAGLQALTGNLGNSSAAVAALSSVVGNSTLAGLNSNSAAALQASLAAGVQAPFLTGDLNLAGLTSNNLGGLSNSLSQSHGLVQMGNAGAAATNNSNVNMSSRMVPSNERNYRVNDNTSTSNFMMGSSTANNAPVNSDNNPSSRNATRDYTSTNRDYENNSSLRTSYDNMKSDSDAFRQLSTNSVYSTMNNGSQNNRSSESNSKGQYSDTILISNLPIQHPWKLLREKFGSIGDVEFVEMKSKDTAVLRFANTWQAERAIKLMDRIRIDGRNLDVRYYY